MKAHVVMLETIKTYPPGFSSLLLDPKEVAAGPWKVGVYPEQAELGGENSINLFERSLKSRLSPELAETNLLAPLHDGKDRAPIDIEHYLEKFIGLEPVGGLSLARSADVAVELLKAYGNKGFEHYQTLRDRKLDLSEVVLKLDGRPFDRLLAELEVGRLAKGSQAAGAVKLEPGAVQVGAVRLRTRT